MSRTAAVDRRKLSVAGLELRGAKGSTVIVTGAPIVFDRSYEVNDFAGSFSETMAPTVCLGLLESCDCRFLLNHDGMPLARTTSGTLQLQNTPEALVFAARLDRRQALASDLIIAIERQDVSQMSVGFIVAEDGDEWSADATERTIHRFSELLDVSAVTFAASPTTSIQLAS